MSIIDTSHFYQNKLESAELILTKVHLQRQRRSITTAVPPVPKVTKKKDTGNSWKCRTSSTVKEAKTKLPSHRKETKSKLPGHKKETKTKLPAHKKDAMSHQSKDDVTEASCQLSEYELQRQHNIEERLQFLESLNLDEAKDGLRLVISPETSAGSVKGNRKKSARNSVAARKSQRLQYQTPVIYYEADSLDPSAPSYKSTNPLELVIRGKCNLSHVEDGMQCAAETDDVVHSTHVTAPSGGSADVSCGSEINESDTFKQIYPDFQLTAKI